MTKELKKNLPKISSINSVNWNDLDLVFLSLPNNEAQKIILNKFDEHKKLKFIDLSADFRIFNPTLYFKTYKTKHKAINLIKIQFTQ